MKRVLSKIIPRKFRKEQIVIPVVRMGGVIASGGTPLAQTLNLANIAKALERAFANKHAPAIAITLNSPGGSPVQSRLIYRRIRDLAAEHNKEVIIFAEDVAASGGYMIAVAGDVIIADPSSIIGSIGVISSSFGFTEAIKKLGVERRVYTAGENKSTLDPFQPAKKEDIERIKTLQLEIHKVFIDIVKERRGDKLADEPNLFTGQFWTGVAAKELGLVDELGDLRSYLKGRFGEKTRMELVSVPRGMFGRRPSVGIWHAGISGFDPKEIAAAMTAGALTTLEERTLWDKYGL